MEFLYNLIQQKKRPSILVCLCLFVSLTTISYAQQETPTRQINHNIHSWVGLLTTHRLTNEWGVTADFIIRREDFLKNSNFYFLRLGGGYWFSDNIALTGAYGNMWLRRSQLQNQNYTLEYRFDQQLQVASKLWRFDVTQRFRAESRWREDVEGDQITGRSYTQRLRYLYSFRLPISRKPSVPQLVFANEILIQFGKQIVYNPLDQIRVFIGIRQSLGNGWAYDMGYFQIFQQTAAGNVYNANHTMRLLFYFSTRKSRPYDNNRLMEDGE